MCLCLHGCRSGVVVNTFACWPEGPTGGRIFVFQSAAMLRKPQEMGVWSFSGKASLSLKCCSGLELPRNTLHSLLLLLLLLQLLNSAAP